MLDGVGFRSKGLGPRAGHRQGEGWEKKGVRVRTGVECLC